MATKVYTESTCEMCGRIKRSEGDEGVTLPIGWAEVVIFYRLSEFNMSENRRIVKPVCPKCAGRLEQFLQPGEASTTTTTIEASTEGLVLHTKDK